MKYIDRKGNIIIESTGQDRLLRLLYDSGAGRAVLRLLVSPLISKAGGAFLSSPFSAGMIDPFIRRNHIDMSEYVTAEYNSYNDFFTRRIRPEARPITGGDNVIVSPCDGKASAFRINPDGRFMIKGREYTVRQLLKSSRLAAEYDGGFILIIRLTVDNYHRYCYPVSGTKSEQTVIPGVFHTVNPAAYEKFQVYAENHREFCLIRTRTAGTVLQIEVGALMVGKITNYSKSSCSVTKGQEKGMFEFGGSTVILMLQKDMAQVDKDLLYHTECGYETIIKMGEQIAVSRKVPENRNNHRF
ncbi:MAG: phosphatidylserine decarboxylase [Blautia sp.]|nr:phosphatidylserine decarboxylase [Blautia sp.]